MEKKIFVTGFGPFEGHENLNASWEAVKLLPDKIEVHNLSFQIKKMEIPVIYDEVDKIVPNIWNENPVLVIHCGVSNGNKRIQLETCAHNRNLCRPDFSNKLLSCNKANLKNNGLKCETLYSNLKVKQFAMDLNLETESIYKFSLDPGEYLCDYIYLKSLDLNLDRSLFIHVPPVNKPFSSEETGNAIYRVIIKCIEQLIDEKKV